MQMEPTNKITNEQKDQALVRQKVALIFLVCLINFRVSPKFPGGCKKQAQTMCLLTQMDHKANNSRPIADVTDRRSDTANVKELWGHQSMDSFMRLKVEKKGCWS